MALRKMMAEKGHDPFRPSFRVVDSLLQFRQLLVIVEQVILLRPVGGRAFRLEPLVFRIAAQFPVLCFASFIDGLVGDERLRVG